MDNYPKHLAPDFDDGGAVATPFDKWWERVETCFPNVPREAAKEWLHRHWGHSPYSWIPSFEYRFILEEIKSSKLREIRTSWSDFSYCNAKAQGQGKFICGDHPNRQWPHEPLWLVTFMRHEKQFPTPIIVLDNSDGHLKSQSSAPKYDRNLPEALILVEGHNRLNIALHLSSQNELKDKLEIFRLEKIYNPDSSK